MVGFYRYGYAMPFYHCESSVSFFDGRLIEIDSFDVLCESKTVENKRSSSSSGTEKQFQEEKGLSKYKGW
jgi:hypothetical protein